MNVSHLFHRPFSTMGLRGSNPGKSAKMAEKWRRAFMTILLLLSLFLLPYGLPVLAQSVFIPETSKSVSDHQAERRRVEQRAESFLSACVQRNWKEASALLSPTSPLVLSDDRTAADDWLVGRLTKYEIWDVKEEDQPTAVLFGCARLNGRGRGTFRFLMTLESAREVRMINHFEIQHEGIDRPPIKCTFRN